MYVYDFHKALYLNCEVMTLGFLMGGVIMQNASKVSAWWCWLQYQKKSAAKRISLDLIKYQ